MATQGFDGIRVLSIGPTTIPLEILPGDRTTVAIESGKVKIVRSGETLSVSQGSSFTAKSTPGRAGSAYVNASVSSPSSTASASATIRGETVTTAADRDANLTADSENAQIPSKITIHVPAGTTIQVKNYVNGKFRVGAIKGPLVINQMVNAETAVDEVTDLNITMLVNCRGYIHATGNIKSGMMVNCDVKLD